MTFTFNRKPEVTPTTFGELPVGAAFRNMFPGGPGHDVFLKVEPWGAVTSSEQTANTVRLTGTPVVCSSTPGEPVVPVRLECNEV